MNSSLVKKILLIGGLAVALLVIYHAQYRGPAVNPVAVSSSESKIYTSNLEQLIEEKPNTQEQLPGATTLTPSFSRPVFNDTASYINPGCITRKLNDYRTWRSETVYHHPSIVHYVKLASSGGGGGGVELSFRDYLSMMSAYKFLRPERIMIHSNVNVHGKYFDLSKEWEGTTVVVNKVKRKTRLNGKGVSFIQHAADYIKVSQVLEYGGLVTDFDVVIINGTRLKEEQRNSECVIAQEGEIPNLGLLSCIKNSSLVRRWRDGYHDNYIPRLWLHNAAFVPLDILTKDQSVCYNVHLEDTMCTHPNAGEAKTQWLKHNGVPHWRTKTAAHYYLREKMLPQGTKLLESDSSMGEMMKYIYDYKIPW